VSHRRRLSLGHNFQLIESGWLLVLSLLLGAAAIWLVRHRTV